MIEVDNTTHEILRLSGEKYASVLEERYGKSVLKHSTGYNEKNKRIY